MKTLFIMIYYPRVLQHRSQTIIFIQKRFNRGYYVSTKTATVLVLTEN